VIWRPLATSDDRLVEDYVLTQPGQELVEGELAAFAKRKHEILRCPASAVGRAPFAYRRSVSPDKVLVRAAALRGNLKLI
jgi:hypothetical protein